MGAGNCPSFKGEYNRCKIGRLTLGDEFKTNINNRRIQGEEEGDRLEKRRCLNLEEHRKFREK